MSGKPWTEERRAAHSAAMRKRWRNGAYARRRHTPMSAAERAKKSAHMRALNEQMKADAILKIGNHTGRLQSWTPERRAAQGEAMRAIMTRPEQRERARQHAKKKNHKECAEMRWRRHRGGAVPPGFEALYRQLVDKKHVPAPEALRMVRAEAERSASR